MELEPKLAKSLEKAGLQEKEALVYAALLSSGGGFPSKIAKITALNRTTVYGILETLSIRGLVSELEKRNKLFYQIEQPKKLERYAKSKIAMAEEAYERARSLLPELEGLYSLAPNKPVVRFFEGSEGVLRVYEDHVSVDKPYEMLAFSNTSDLMQFISEKFRNDYIRKKEKFGITTRAILPDQEVDVNYNQTIYANFSEKIWPKLKHVPRSVFPYKSDLTIYGDNKVSVINFSEPQPAGTIIEDKTVHDMMKMIFELAWAGVNSNSTPTYHQKTKRNK